MRISKEQEAELLDGFNWKRVHAVLKLLNWKWSFGGVPDINAMKNAAHDLVGIINKQTAAASASKGGFKVWIDENEDNAEIGLEFVLTSNTVAE